MVPLLTPPFTLKCTYIITKQLFVLIKVLLHSLMEFMTFGGFFEVILAMLAQIYQLYNEVNQ